MNGERERMLLEMGLGPIWKLRAPVAERRISEDAQGIIADGGGGIAPQSFEPVSRIELAAGAPDVSPPSASPDATASGDDRTSVILRMDWAELREAVAGCSACGLCTSRRNTVFGVGNQAAPWMIIGEAPGAEEDARGDPFVGQAGQLLDAMLAAVGMTRERDVFIANVLKCRPPGNRNPDPQEVARCLPHLLRQVALVKPQLILLMGRFAAHAMLATETSIASLRGRLHQVASTPAIVTYHPAYLLRTPLDKAKSWEDLVFARATWKALQSTADNPTLPP
jgi:DNA polymerase